MDFLADLVASYLFGKFKTLIKRINYHGIYRYDSIVMLKGNKSVQYINKLVSRVSKNSEQGGGKPTPPFHRENMDK